ncbi:hypothetical protein VP01_352g1 [Puccinia sorghi]|uniref:Uncharacterized protein n=1 Tax=Puccinia sorghi TaxID=27349 RepID=A0A0L6UVH0_9BASI|nr:hypothetical protein VP01_352g1 [Puccinia sorghi]
MAPFCKNDAQMCASTSAIIRQTFGWCNGGTPSLSFFKALPRAGSSTEKEDKTPSSSSPALSYFSNDTGSTIQISNNLVPVDTNNDSTPQIKLCTEKLNESKFSAWRYDMQNALAKRKQVTTFIRLHLGREDSTRFVDDLDTYDPKTLWELIVSYHSAKSIENTANIMEKLHNIVFVEGEMQKSINLFRQNFPLMIEVSSGKFDKKTLEAVWVFFVLKRLPPSFSAFPVQLTSTASALAFQNVSQTSSSGISTSPSGQKHQSHRPVCSNGTHNPATAHSKDDCHQLHPDKSVAYFKAAIDRCGRKTVSVGN